MKPLKQFIDWFNNPTYKWVGRVYNVVVVRSGKNAPRISRQSVARRIEGRLRWEHIVIAFLLGLLVASHAQPTIIHNIAPIKDVSLLKPIQTLPEPELQPQAVLEPVWENKLRPYGTYGGADYVPGQCTFGVAQRLPIPPSWGNANQWPTSASYAGYGVGTAPKAGSVAVSYTDSWLGHVAVVESVNPDGSFVIWEENGPGGPYSTDERTATTAEFSTFIYIP